MITLNLPELVAGRDMADEIVDKLGPLDRERVVVEAGNLVNGSASFAGQLVKRVLVGATGAELIVVGAPTRFNQYLSRAAELAGTVDRLELPDGQTAGA